MKRADDALKNKTKQSIGAIAGALIDKDRRPISGKIIWDTTNSF